MPDIEITEECRALIAAEFPFDESERRLPNGIRGSGCRRCGDTAKAYPTASSALSSSPSTSAATDMFLEVNNFFTKGWGARKLSLQV
jgi:hypothetical protein